MKSHLVIIPTYNEKENIRSIISAVKELSVSFDVLVIDDGSPDGTADIVRDVQKVTPGLHLEERTGKLGLGTAYIHGFKWALAHNYDFIYEMDADFSHNPKDLVRMAGVLTRDQADVVVGSRYVEDGGVIDWPRKRLWLSKGASFYVRMITRMPVRDVTAGFVGYKNEVLSALNLDKIRFVGYSFQIEMKFASWTTGFRIKEIPILFKDRELGKSKMSTNIVHEAIFGVLKMKLDSFTKDYKVNENG
ncbi:polyprenol monophosphomannose synthase [Membranihabitans marinus]|uniref:polyprenol monophosphomannose synthase n=1 Tax=Membranihabitans marinus TaxID=1227546 RepID=UPI0028F7143D|nr:polyprenol monophosphomannose synthase [Membranihabitans marinus]